MSHPIVHAEIRSSDPDATRAFFGELFGWTYPTEGAYPGYTFVDTGVPDALYTAISPLQGESDLVTFFIGVEDMATSIAETTRLGGKVVQEPVNVPGVQFALIADPWATSSGWPSSSAGGALQPAPRRRVGADRDNLGRAAEAVRRHVAVDGFILTGPHQEGLVAEAPAHQSGA